MTETKTDKWVKYASTEKYKAIDTIGVPHLYCITPKHLEFADSMYLNDETIARAESKGAVCDTCRRLAKRDGTPILPMSEHKLAILVEVNDDRKLNEMPELHAYLLSIKAQAEADGYVGFAFVKAKGIK